VKAEAQNNNADAIVGTRRVGRGRGKGGSLDGAGDSVVPC
jgi:hypothetical protein